MIALATHQRSAARLSDFDQGVMDPLREADADFASTNDPRAAR
jgi:hypothetical protein